MRLGALDSLITIEQPITVADAFGGSGEVTWTPLTNQMWASMDTSLSSETVAADRVESSYPVKWLMRYTTAITEAMRISYDGSYYQIKGISQTKRLGFMEVQTEKVT